MLVDAVNNKDDKSPEQTSENMGDVECRKETRFPCVSIPLLYSAARDSYNENVGEKIYKAAVIDMSLYGLAFDVDQPLRVHDKLMILIEKPDEADREKLAAEVRWCKPLPDGLYRVGLKISIEQKHQDQQQDISKSGQLGVSDTPKEVEINCPACHNRSTFNFLAYQPVLGGAGVMPLYDCSSCGTTRSLAGILN